jgi:hypothetical protein
MSRGARSRPSVPTTPRAVARDQLVKATLPVKTTVSVDLPDGRFAGGTTPVVLTLP